MLSALQVAEMFLERVHNFLLDRGEVRRKLEAASDTLAVWTFRAAHATRCVQTRLLQTRTGIGVANLRGVLMVGLTGGIGSGKSTVAALLTARGAVVVDADLIARQVVEPGTPALEKLVARFGAEILYADGTLDRAKLAERAFGTDETKQDLEAITHPAIGEEFLRQVAAAPDDGIVVHDVPLLVESKRGLQYDAVIVVETPKEQRLDRLEQRGIPRADAERRMALQATDEDRRAIATWVLDNSGDVANLEAQVERVWTELRGQAEKKATETPAKP